MNIIYKLRGRGKTTELIKRADNHNGYIVCHNQKEAKRILRQAKKKGYKINFPITYYEFLTGIYHGKGVRSVHIDNVEMLLQELSHVPIENISLTKNEDNTQ